MFVCFPKQIQLSSSKRVPSPAEIPAERRAGGCWWARQLPGVRREAGGGQPPFSCCLSQAIFFLTISKMIFVTAECAPCKDKTKQEQQQTPPKTKQTSKREGQRVCRSKISCLDLKASREFALFFRRLLMFPILHCDLVVSALLV